jgi:hypothetical protein
VTEVKKKYNIIIIEFISIYIKMNK